MLAVPGGIVTASEEVATGEVRTCSSAPCCHTGVADASLVGGHTLSRAVYGSHFTR